MGRSSKRLLNSAFQMFPDLLVVLSAFLLCPAYSSRSALDRQMKLTLIRNGAIESEID